MLRQPSKFNTLLTDPVGVLARRARWLGQVLRYRLLRGYRSRAYWTHRLGRHGLGLRGVGCDSLSDEENRRMYEQARTQFLELCRDEVVELPAARVLDVGCGTGFYAGILAEAGCRQYVGVDITDALFGELRQRFQGFTFRRLDVTETGAAAQDLAGPFDLILMIDVTQHITEPARFSAAMQAIRRNLAEGGVFIVTSWLDAAARHSFFEVSRDLTAYKNEFPGYRFSAPRPFRDKFIFAIRPQTSER